MGSRIAACAASPSTRDEAGRETMPPLRPAAGSGARSVELCDCMIDIAAAIFNIPGKEIRRPGRTTLSIARIRQIAMYVAHVVLGLSMSEVGRGFQRDRTTVLHACHLIEDMRDDEDFDRIVVMVERVATAAFRGQAGL